MNQARILTGLSVVSLLAIMTAPEQATMHITPGSLVRAAIILSPVAWLIWMGKHP